MSRNRKKLYGVQRIRYRDDKFLYEDVLRRFQSKKEATYICNQFNSEYNNATMNRKPIFDDYFKVVDLKKKR